MPENYFDHFEARLFAQIESEKFPKSTGFIVPENYFSRFDAPIIKNEGTKVIALSKKYIRYAAAIAAVLIIGITIFKIAQKESAIDTINISAIDRYIDEGNLNMDLYDLTSYLESRDIPINDFENQYFAEATLEDYLLENMDEELLLDD